MTDGRKDLEAKAMTITAEFEAPIDRVWKLWADPHQLEISAPQAPTRSLDAYALERWS